MNEQILETKCHLYSLLLRKDKIDNRGLTDNEVDLLFSLSSDEQVQEFLKKK